LIFNFTSCKKDSVKDLDSGEITMHADDQSQFASELDGIINDGNIALESSPVFSGRFQNQQNVICDATIVTDVNSNPRTITITYNGTNCTPGHSRTGTVIISMAQGVQWKNAGAEVNVSFQDVKVTRTRDNKNVTINGTQTYTNVSGGLLINLPTLNTITHRVSSSGINVSFNDGTARNWQVDKQRVFTYNNGVVITTSGLHTVGNVTQVAEWGTNRFGNTFTTAITTPLVFRQDCNFRLTSGIVQHKTSLFTATATFGLDANGSPTGCPGTGNYYFKIEWTGLGGNTHSALLPY